MSIADLHQIRDHELTLLAEHLPPGGKLLELGAGTGFQARELAARGFAVTAIDLPSSNYHSLRVYPVTDYDGKTIPFPDQTFDVVFSSNVLEHVRNLPTMLREIRRVLKPGGYAVHAMPSSTWRLWTTLAGPATWIALFAATLRGNAPQPPGSPPRHPLLVLARGTAARFVPLPHGETGNAFTELVTFSKRHWINQFERNGFAVVRAEPMKLFYTGWSVLGLRLPLDTRKRLARFLGSACAVYEVHPN